MSSPPGESALSPEPTVGASLVRTALAIAGTRVLLLVSGVVTSVLIARALGPEGRGQYAVLVAIAGTAVVLGHSSIEQAQVFLVGRGADMSVLSANAVWLGTLLGILVAGVTALVTVALEYPNPRAFQQPALPIALLAVPLSIVVLLTNGLLVLSGRTRVLNRSMLLSGAVQFVLLVIAAIAHRLTVTTVVLAWTLSAGTPLLLTLHALRPHRAHISPGLAREAFGFGIRYHGAMVSRFLLLRVDVLILAAMKDDRSVGLYALAVTLIELTNVATDAVSTAVLQRQTHLPLALSARLTARVVGLSGGLAAIAATALLALSPTLVPLVFGQNFRDCVPALFALGPGVVALAMARSASSYLLRHNRPLVNSAIAFAALAVNATLNLALIPRWGIVGCGLASSVAYVLLAIGHLIWLRQTAGLTSRDFKPDLAGLLRRD